jgi:hypothetical protein
MSLISRLFGKTAKPTESDKPLVPVPIPPLAVLLDALEKKKARL